MAARASARSTGLSPSSWRASRSGSARPGGCRQGAPCGAGQRVQRVAQQRGDRPNAPSCSSMAQNLASFGVSSPGASAGMCSRATWRRRKARGDGFQLDDQLAGERRCGQRHQGQARAVTRISAQAAAGFAGGETAASPGGFPYTADSARGHASPVRTAAMIITSLLDTDLCKFTMMQVVLHQFPGAQVSTASAAATPASTWPPTPARSATRSAPCAACISRTPNLPQARCASSRATLLTFWVCSGSTRSTSPSPPCHRARSTSPSAAPGCTPSCSKSRVLAIVNEVWFRNATPVPDFVEGRKRLDHKIALLQARAARPQDCGLRHPQAIFKGLARRGASCADRAAAHRRGRGSSPAPATCCSR